MNRALPGLLLVFALSSAVACSDPPVAPTSPTVSTTVARIEGLVRDSQARPVADALVQISDGPQAGRATTTDAEGGFAFTSVAVIAGSVGFRVSKDGFDVARARWQADAPLVVVVLSQPPSGSLAGLYTLTVMAAATCSEIPAHVRTRAYTAAIEPSAADGRRFELTLEGATFYDFYDTAWGIVDQNGARLFVSSLDAFNAWLEDHPLFERLAPTEYFGVHGTATLPPGRGNEPIVTRLTGEVSYCLNASRQPNADWPPLCGTPVTCQSAEHELTLTRR